VITTVVDQAWTRLGEVWRFVLWVIMTFQTPLNFSSPNSDLVGT